MSSFLCYYLSSFLFWFLSFFIVSFYHTFLPCVIHSLLLSSPSFILPFLSFSCSSAVSVILYFFVSSFSFILFVLSHILLCFLFVLLSLHFFLSLCPAFFPTSVFLHMFFVSVLPSVCPSLSWNICHKFLVKEYMLIYLERSGIVGLLGF